MFTINHAISQLSAKKCLIIKGYSQIANKNSFHILHFVKNLSLSRIFHGKNNTSCKENKIFNAVRMQKTKNLRTRRVIKRIMEKIPRYFFYP